MAGTLLAKTLYSSLNNDTSLVVLTFKDWPFYLLRNNNDVVIQRKFSITLSTVCLYFCAWIVLYYSVQSVHIIMWWCLHLISHHNN